MKKLISEDSTTFNVQRQQSGNTARQDSKGETAPQANQVKDFINANKNDDNSKAPVLKPYPLNLAEEVISDMFISVSNLRLMLENAAANPALKKQYMQNLSIINEKGAVIHKAILDIYKELDKIV
jgi:hypothetical protein